jgi:hypothetical protein
MLKFLFLPSGSIRVLLYFVVLHDSICLSLPFSSLKKRAIKSVLYFVFYFFLVCQWSRYIQLVFYTFFCRFGLHTALTGTPTIAMQRHGMIM